MIKSYDDYQKELNETKGYSLSGKHYFSSDGLVMPPKTNEDYENLYRQSDR
jgi:hypothetical protein